MVQEPLSLSFTFRSLDDCKHPLPSHWGAIRGVLPNTCSHVLLPLKSHSGRAEAKKLLWNWRRPRILWWSIFPALHTLLPTLSLHLFSRFFGPFFFLVFVLARLHGFCIWSFCILWLWLIWSFICHLYLQRSLSSRNLSHKHFSVFLQSRAQGGKEVRRLTYNDNDTHFLLCGCESVFLSLLHSALFTHFVF